MLKVFINSENKATIICPQCKKNKIVDVSQYKDLERAVQINCKCPCGHTYKALLERRKFYRKGVNLSGKYIGGEKGGGTIMIKDVSRTGLKIQLKFEADFKIGDTLWLEFNLDNSVQSFIRKEVIVKKINGLAIGVEFCNKEHYDDFGPYLLYVIN